MPDKAIIFKNMGSFNGALIEPEEGPNFIRLRSGWDGPRVDHLSLKDAKILREFLTKALLYDRRGDISDRRAYRDGDRRKGEEGLRGPGCTYIGKEHKYPSHDRRKNTWDGRVCRRKSGERRICGRNDDHNVRRHSMRRHDDRKRFL